MKHYGWLNYRGTRGAQGRFHFKGKMFTKMFSGGAKRDLIKKAQAWVLQKKIELGSPLGSLLRYRTGYCRKSNSLPVGVTVGSWMRGKYKYAAAHANLEKRKQTSVKFSFLRYGEARAIRFAIAAREKMLAEIKKRP